MKRLVLGIGVIVLLGLSLVGAYLATSPDPAAQSTLFADLPEMVALPGGAMAYRPAGQFRRGSTFVDAPVGTVDIAINLEIMRYPVTQSEYTACVTAGACNPTVSRGAADLPQTRVSFVDAVGFARWQSDRTGQVWRLPTDAEWAHAAAERFVDDAVGEAGNPDDPAQRWLRSYQANTSQRGEADPTVRPLGFYGDNALGVGYLGGNVWDWTSTCFHKAVLDDAGGYADLGEGYCGVRLAAGLHRAFIIDFVRDARVGGCAVGLPPDHLGIRLVRER